MLYEPEETCNTNCEVEKGRGESSTLGLARHCDWFVMIANKVRCHLEQDRKHPKGFDEITMLTEILYGCTLCVPVFAIA